MYLTQLRLRNVGPFDDVTLPFTDEHGEPRRVTVILGESGAGKTTLLGAIAHPARPLRHAAAGAGGRRGLRRRALSPRRGRSGASPRSRGRLADGRSRRGRDRGRHPQA
ncbi:MAG: AAA family ATPase [Myxococcales bacterium]|nr:AAA family ATPase [Myxococcales bacterium]